MGLTHEEISAGLEVRFLEFKEEERAKNILNKLATTINQEQLRLLYEVIFIDGVIWGLEKMHEKLTKD